MKKPINVTSLSGTIEKLEMPLQAKPIIFISGYFVSPAGRALRS